MTTATHTHPSPEPTGTLPLSRLSPLVLLGIYLIVPALALFVMIDYIATDLDFSRRIAFDTHLMLVASLLLQAPHAIASLFTFADREYTSTYKGTLIKCGLIGLATLILILLVGDILLMLCLIAYNFYHQSSQQAGIAAMVAGNKSRLHEVWRWMSVIIQLVGFIALLANNNPDYHMMPDKKAALTIAAVLFMACFAVVSVIVARQSKTAMGRLLIGAQAVMLYLYVAMYIINLPLLMILAPVVVHDLTAFAFYINHNTNRNRETRFNYFSRIRNVVPMPEYVLTPLVALLLGASMFMSGSAEASYFAIVAIVLNVMHIYVEGKMWKAGSLHRKYTLV